MKILKTRDLKYALRSTLVYYIKLCKSVIAYSRIIRFKIGSTEGYRGQLLDAT